MKKIIELTDIKRNFQVGEETVHALRGISFTINEGEFVTIMGTSGSGKSALLNTLGCLDTPSSGEYLLDGIPVRTMSKNERAILRNRKIGFVFQSYNLLAKTTAIENVELPLMYNAAINATERKNRAVEALKAVGLGDRLMHKSNQMSGGQMQRVAIARALASNPKVLLADEPTGALDTVTSYEVMELIQGINDEGKTILIVTHEPDIAAMCKRNVILKDGVIIDDKYVEQVREAVKEENAEILVVAAKTEADIAELETYEDRQMFLQEVGLKESGVNRLIKSAYHLLELETFITAGEMEVKAWTYRKGWKAPQCAGVIHTDFEKGFIRAEVIKYEDYIKYGSEAAVKEAGKMGVEGKEYIVQDGDIMHFRFNV